MSYVLKLAILELGKNTLFAIILSYSIVIETDINHAFAGLLMDYLYAYKKNFCLIVLHTKRKCLKTYIFWLPKFSGIKTYLIFA